MLIVAPGMYLIANHFHTFAPQALVRTWVDTAIPFIPNTFWLYFSEYILFFAVYFMTDDLLELNKYVYSFMILQLTSCLIFWAWPTTYPRELFPLPADLNSATKFAFATLRRIDTPTSCCPSLHVSSCYLSAFLFLRQKRRYFLFFLGWATAVAVATLTTKQHYLIDVVTGLLMAVVHYWFFHRCVRYRARGVRTPA